VKKGLETSLFTLLFGLLFLFFIQQLTTLVEAVYRYNLIEKEFGPATFGLIAFCAPLFLFFVKTNIEQRGYGILWLFLLLRCLIPWLPNPLLIFITGISVALFLNVFIIILSGKLGDHEGTLAPGMVMAVLISISLRAFGSTLDVSQTDSMAIIGYLLVLLAGFILWQLQKKNNVKEHQIDVKNTISDCGRYFYMIGIFSVVGFIYLFLASPGVLARWTGADYLLINMTLSASLALLILVLNNSAVLSRIKKWHLAIGNILFCLFLLLNISLQVIDKLNSPEAEPIIVYSTTLSQHMITYAMLFLSPVLFLDFSVFLYKFRGTSLRMLAGPALVSSLILLMVILSLIFSNIWGYLGPLGTLFRQRFYLPFVLLTVGVILPLTLLKNLSIPDADRPSKKFGLTLGGVILYCLTTIGIFWTESSPSEMATAKTRIRCMTYNLQQGTDHLGNRSYQQQLAVIRRMNPDILCLQESDVARISSGNNDIVRYLSDKLDYYSYYGPSTINGTFGTAILSRFPLSGCRSIFTYSDQDEIGTTVCRILIKGETIFLVNNHPAGSDSAMQSHLNMLIKLVQQNDRIIAMGDFNFEPSSPFYNQITATLIDSWLYDKLESAGKRIDYIFLSKNFKVMESNVIPSPESASDHPVYSTVIEFVNRRIRVKR